MMQGHDGLLSWIVYFASVSHYEVFMKCKVCDKEVELRIG